MLEVTVVVTRDTATPAVAALAEGLRPENVLAIFGRSVANAVRSNFDDLEGSRPNKLGGTRTHYYSGARSGTRYVVEGDSATVGIAQVGIRLRYFGGTVEAGVNPSFTTGKPTRYLTIPATAESYGHRAADFPDMVVLWGGNGPYALARVTPKVMATVKASGPQTSQTEVLFWLKASVDVPADRTMLPSDEQIRTAVTGDFNRYVRTLWRLRAASGGG
jgi:hypothetical protein